MATATPSRSQAGMRHRALRLADRRKAGQTADRVTLHAVGQWDADQFVVWSVEPTREAAEQEAWDADKGVSTLDGTFSGRHYLAFVIDRPQGFRPTGPLDAPARLDLDAVHAAAPENWTDRATALAAARTYNSDPTRDPEKWAIVIEIGNEPGIRSERTLEIVAGVGIERRTAYRPVRVVKVNE